MDEFYQIESMMRKIKENLSANSSTLVDFVELSKAYWLTRKYCDDSFLQESIERLFFNIIQLQYEYDLSRDKEIRKTILNFY